jgi:hypothetical protein
MNLELAKDERLQIIFLFLVPGKKGIHLVDFQQVMFQLVIQLFKSRISWLRLLPIGDNSNLNSKSDCKTSE